MIRVIDVDAMMMMAEGVRNGVLNESDYHGFAEAFYCGIRKYIDEYAKIIEYEPNILCKDCKHGRPQEFHDAFDKPYYQYSCSKLGHLVGAEFYCAFGERKDEQDY